MSITWESVDKSKFSNRIRASIDPRTVNEFNFPSNYKFSSCVLTRKFINYADRISNFNVREDDIWIVGFPKTGTTWMHNIVWQLKNNFNFQAPSKKADDEFFEAAALFHHRFGDDQFGQLVDELEDQFKRFDELPSPRIFKSHLPAYLLPKGIWKNQVKPRIIYIARNEEDTIISLFHMMRNSIMTFEGSSEDLVEDFINNGIMFTPFHGHVLSYWQLKHLDHVLFTTYEELSSDLFAQVERVAKFLDASYDEKQLKQLVEYVSFESMSKQRMEPFYVLRGSSFRYNFDRISFNFSENIVSN